MFNAQAQATQRLGNAVADIGQQAGQLAYNLQRASNFKTETTVQLAMDEEWAKFQETRNPSSDETKWQEDWNKQLQNRINKEVPKAAGPVLKQNLEQRINAFKTRSGAEIGQQAKAVSVEKSKIAGQTMLNTQWANGDVQGAEGTLRQMADLGLIYHEEIPAYMKKGLSTMDAQQVSKLINDNPISATDALEEQTAGGKWKNFKHLDEDDRLRALNQARTQTSALRTQTYQGLVDSAMNGEAIGTQQLQGLVDRGLLTATQAKTYKRSYADGKLSNSPEAIGDLMGKVYNYDPQKDPHGDERNKILAQMVSGSYDAKVLSYADSVFKEKLDPNNVLNTPVMKDAFQGVDKAFNSGIYGDFNKTYMDMKTGRWVTETDPATFNRAMEKKRRIEDGLRKFATDNPTATGTQTNEFITGMQMDDAVKTGRQILLETPSAVDDVKAKRARLDALLSK